MSTKWAAIVKLHLAGNSNSEIIQSLKAWCQLVSKAIKRFAEPNLLEDWPRTSQPTTAVTTANIKLIRDHIHYDLKQSAEKLANDL